MEYKSLTEKQKIILRIKMAEIIALEEIEKGTDLEPILKKLIEEESYCGAEGIKRVLEYKKSKQSNPPQECYKTGEECKYNCKGLCRNSC